ncbi:NUDIX hydrolase [Capnocytophaga canimorsus]|uniref:NUDIX hydrolase n=1 Tax=Capnocytophaga canimorsus TaxID=28188 RepID=UPI0037D4C871
MKTFFNFCPSCGSSDIIFPNQVRLSCNDCGFVYFHNIAAAVAVVFTFEGQVLFTVRNQEPDKGKLDLPGGFIDPEENAEQAACREIREEMGLEIAPNRLKYITTQPNNYLYKDVLYRTMDIFFECPLQNQDLSVAAPDEIKALIWKNPKQMDFNEIGFVSIRKVIENFYGK